MSDPVTSAPRLYVDSDLMAGVIAAATDAQSHYLLSVMRRGAGDTVLLFNGRDGEWAASIAVGKKKHVSFSLLDQRRPQEAPADLTLLFAPLKTSPMEFLVEKATELGVSALMPVITRRSVMQRVNLRRLTAIAMEAAEQCERLTVPRIANPQALGAVLDEWVRNFGDQRLLFLDEGAARNAAARPIATALAGMARPPAILIGPEGGFDAEEQALLRGLPFVTPAILGPRIFRAETAALAALTCCQALAGEWRAR